MKIVFLNIQNLFFRFPELDNAMEPPTSHWLSEMDSLMEKLHKGKRELHRIEELSLLLGFQRISKKRYGILSNRRGGLYLKEGIDNHLIGATPETAWDGWMKIRNRPVHTNAVANKIRLLADMDADILVLQEVEDRYALEKFLDKAAAQFPRLYYPNIQILEGLDPRGVEQAIVYRKGISLTGLKPLVSSNESVRQSAHIVAYEIDHPVLESILIISVYFPIIRQEKDVAEQNRYSTMKYLKCVYQDYKDQGQDKILIMGNFRTPGYCFTLAPLFRNTDLLDLTVHQSFHLKRRLSDDAIRYPSASSKEVVGKQDFLLLSPVLHQKVIECGLNWHGKFWPSSSRFESYRNLNSTETEASNSPALWVKI